MKNTISIKERFSGYLPVIIDVETGGTNAATDALLELGAVFVGVDNSGQLAPTITDHFNIEPFEKSRITDEALRINKIKPFHPFRLAKQEKQALDDLFTQVRKQLEKYQCSRAVLVGHNAHFDLQFIHAAVKRCKIKNMPFHQFTCFDTATLGAIAYGQSVLARALKQANIEFDKNKAHSALYDAKVTAELFCQIVNRLDANNNQILQEVPMQQ